VFLTIVRKRDRFEVRRGRALLAVYDNFPDAEDAAIRAWLHKSLDDEAEHHRLMLRQARAQGRTL
jgi:hypothetical protein